MEWLREHGLISSYDDYVGLPACVLDDARLVMEWDVTRRQKARQQPSEPRGRR